MNNRNVFEVIAETLDDIYVKPASKLLKNVFETGVDVVKETYKIGSGVVSGGVGVVDKLSSIYDNFYYILAGLFIAIVILKKI